MAVHRYTRNFAEKIVETKKIVVRNCPQDCHTENLSTSAMLSDEGTMEFEKANFENESVPINIPENETIVVDVNM